MEKLNSKDMERLSELMSSLEKSKGDEYEKKLIEEKIKDFFRETGMKSFRYNDIVIRFTDDRTTEQFDVDMLREKYPEIWAECKSVKVRPAYLYIRKEPSKKETVGESA